jgi:hypothetical protein
MDVTDNYEGLTKCNSFQKEFKRFLYKALSYIYMHIRVYVCICPGLCVCVFISSSVCACVYVFSFVCVCVDSLMGFLNILVKNNYSGKIW